MTRDPVQAVIVRNLFYRRLHYYALAVLLVGVMVIGLLIGVLVYITGNYTHPLYFATDNVGRLIKVIPVQELNMSEEDVVAWTVKAVEDAYSFDYVNYRSQLQSAQKYFTEYGWKTYIDALKASNNLIALDRNKLVITANVVGNPQILTRGKLSGAYAWRIRMQVLVNYLYPPYDDSTKMVNPVMFTVIVQRQPVLKSYKGLGILQMIGTIATAPVNAPKPVSTTPP